MLRPLVAILSGAAILACAATADAAPRALRFMDLLRPEAGDITVPPEWDGVWASEDSVYDCEGVLQSVEAYLDTLCSGQVISFADDEGIGFAVTCDGTVTATVVDATCSGGLEVMPDCTASYDLTLHAERTGDSYVGTSRTELAYVGSAFGCDLIPGSCTVVVTRATRLGPAPAAYCATPAHRESWGTIKTRYR